MLFHFERYVLSNLSPNWALQLVSKIQVMVTVIPRMEMEGAGYFCSLATIHQTKRCQDTESRNRILHSREKFKSHKPQKPRRRYQNILDYFEVSNNVHSWQLYIRPNGVRTQNTKIGIFTAVRSSNLTNLKNHTTDITNWLFWSFQLGEFLQLIHLFIPTNAHMLNVHWLVEK